MRKYHLIGLLLILSITLGTSYGTHHHEGHHHEGHHHKSSHHHDSHHKEAHHKETHHEKTHHQKTDTKQEGSNQEIPYQVEEFVTGLQVPWEMVMAPDGRMFLTERPGVIKVVEQGKLKEEPMISFEAPFISDGEGGLLVLL